MSTRAQIQVKGSPILIYKHCDGYPEGVLPILVPFVDAFAKNRGDDVAYCLAQIIRLFQREEQKQDQIMADKFGEPVISPKFTGWGLDLEIHGDIEYFYVVDLEEKVVRIQKKNFRKE